MFDVDNCLNIFIEYPAYINGAALFMKVAGTKSENIQLLDTDIKNAKKDFEFGKDVDSKVIIQKIQHH